MGRYSARVIAWLARLRASYGFIPAMMSIGAAVLAIGLLLTPPSWGATVAEALYLPRAPDADAMRELLSLIANAIIGTGAVAFSVLIAATVNAAGQYGPRILTNFLADRMIQVTLGAFVATFVYAVIVFAAVRTEADDYELAGLVAVALAFVSIAALVFFLHHAPAGLRINQVIANIGKSLIHNIDDRFPGNCGHAVTGERLVAARRAYEERGEGVPLTAKRAGTVSIIDGDELSRAAARAGIVLTIRTRPGAFVVKGQVLADVHGPPPNAAWRAELRDAFATAELRTPRQDSDFFADELVEIALRALSPGINDPVTAVACMEWLSAALGRIAADAPPSPHRGRKGGEFRLYAPVRPFSDYLTATMGRIRQASATNVVAAEGHFRALAAIAVPAPDREDMLSEVRREAKALLDQAGAALTGPDLMAVRQSAERFDAALAERPVALDKV